MAKLPSGAYATPANFSNNFSSLKAKHQKHESRIARYRGCGNPAAYAEPLAPSERAIEEAWPRVQAAVKRATAERAARWKQFTAATPAAPSFEEANEETRLAFMTSNEGATFLALAEEWSRNGTLYTVQEETGLVLYRSPKASQSTTQSMAAPGIRDRKELLYDGTGDW